MSGLSNERHPLYWFDIRLVYTTHALDRLEERGIDRVDYLPPRARFVKNRKSKFEHGYLFKYQQDKKEQQSNALNTYYIPYLDYTLLILNINVLFTIPPARSIHSTFISYLIVLSYIKKANDNFRISHVSVRDAKMKEASLRSKLLVISC